LSGALPLNACFQKPRLLAHSPSSWCAMVTFTVRNWDHNPDPMPILPIASINNNVTAAIMPTP